MDTPAAFTELEIDALKELMNTGVGKSARALSELLGRHVRLSVPDMVILEGGSVQELSAELSKTVGTYSMASQTFSGSLSGAGFFLITHDECLSIAKTIGLSQDFLDDVVKDIVEELSNLVLVSCVGYMASNLGHKSHFSPPLFQGTNDAANLDLAKLYPEACVWVGLHTSFTFAGSTAGGHLLLAIDGKSRAWLKEALGYYVRGFEC